MDRTELLSLEHTLLTTFQQLETCVGRAQAILPVAQAEQLLDLLPTGGIEVQRFVLIELVKRDMNSAAENGQVRLLDFYLPSCGKWLGPDRIPIDLVLEELQVRRDSGQSPTLMEYQHRFPRWADALADFRWEQQSTRHWSVGSYIPGLEAGQTLDDFHIIRTLGRGAFAQVYLARQESMQRLVALKVSSRVTDESQLLSQLDHPNIVRVYDQRRIAELDIHLLYMQVILGGTLARVIRETRACPIQQLNGAELLRVIDEALVEVQQIPPERGKSPLKQMNWAATTAWLGAQLANGLQAAHDRGVYHYDVKPANILLSPEGQPKLADFNVSVLRVGDEIDTRVGGTLAYMSPEQLLAASLESPGPKLDQRSDLYSLAIVLWEFWQGTRPWSVEGSDTRRSAVQQQVEARMQPLSSYRADNSAAGQWLERVLRHALHQDPQQRPVNCREFSTRLQLAQHPELVGRFAPEDGTLQKRLLQLPVLLVTAVIIFATNGPAGALNYSYNEQAIISKFERLLPFFAASSTLLNIIAFSTGGILLVCFCWKVRQALQRASQNLAARDSDIDWVWKFGHRAAVISGGMWLVFGLIFPITMQLYQPDFGWGDFMHFFMSLAVCGGMALIYPFFGVSLLTTLVYYPQIISPTMRDASFEIRAEWLRRRASVYLVLSAVVPLIALGLLTMVGSVATRGLQLLLVVLTLVGLVVSFKAHQWLLRALNQYASVFDPESPDSTPSGRPLV
ncbi:MAG: serine/threonine protein kinase [Pirellulaceae bacterium]|nr:serine/threonine protein kinase [Pirellulaceae bacterium]